VISCGKVCCLWHDSMKRNVAFWHRKGIGYNATKDEQQRMKMHTHYYRRVRIVLLLHHPSRQYELMYVPAQSLGLSTAGISLGVYHCI
jgi:hypothetical protein